MPIPQFGEPGLDGPYPDRPAAFAVIAQEGLIAVVEVERRGRGLVIDLPGGGIDPGETAIQAAVRECGEEAGLVVRLAPEPFARADHFFRHDDAVVRNTRGQFFVGERIGDDPKLKIEIDHDLRWVAPDEAVRRLDRDSHAWAVAAWLRLRARQGTASSAP
ncbi:MAG: NUDIX domain-containing protein [Phenylobacterium sp.]|nr:NUDIX domain-containing protein [Phenylobacterium sp.]